MKIWTVTYTAKRKRTVYEHQDVSVTFTEADCAKLIGPAHTSYSQLELEMCAVEVGEAKLDVWAWEVGSTDEEPMDDSDFDILEGETQEGNHSSDV